MNASQFKLLAVFAIFAIIGFGPISPGCLIGMFVVLNRPAWFRELVNNVYAIPQPQPIQLQAKSITQARIKCFANLLGLFILDIAPVPITPVVALVIILTRPAWFYRLCASIYASPSNNR